jgi:RNA polymerase sigma-70 factor (ECF subfamily)
VIERRRLMAKIADAIATLPHDQQVVFAMCDLEQLQGTDVARALGIPEGTLWRRLHHARRAIRAALEESP